MDGVLFAAGNTENCLKVKIPENSYWVRFYGFASGFTGFSGVFCRLDLVEQHHVLRLHDAAIFSGLCWCCVSHDDGADTEDLDVHPDV